MAATIIDGKGLARRVREVVAGHAARLREAGVTPCLAVIHAGDDPGSEVYVRNKRRAAEKAGIDVRIIRMSATVGAGEVAQAIAELNADAAVHGILVQLPLPPTIDRQTQDALLLSVDPQKDVDGLHPVSLGLLAAGQPGFVACTPTGCMRMLEDAGVDPSGKHAVVIGRSNIVGKPMALLLLQANATVTICHSRTADLAAEVRRADIVIAAVGRPKLVKAEWIKPGAAVIDVGINRLPNGKLCGDVDFDAVVEVAGAVSPVPGGVGPMTIASLLVNTCQAAAARVAGQ